MSGSRSTVAEERALSWLLEDEQPAVRYAALVDLLDRREDDPDVRRARRSLGRVGWAAEQLRGQGPEGFWERTGPRRLGEWVTFLYFPKFRSTFWRALVLADLGLDSTDPRIRKIADLFFGYKLRLGSPLNWFYEEPSVAGNVARMMTRFGFGEDFRVRKLYDWLLEDQRKDGGWGGDQGTPGSLETWEPLAALASVPKAKRTGKMTRALERGAEFYLERRLFRSGKRYAPWFRFHYPNHYFYDVLVGLDLLTGLGYGADRRLGPALEVLRAKRRRDGTWLMDRVHPDIAPGSPYSPDWKTFKPLVLEPASRPSKWITLRAMTVLKRVEAAR